MSFSSSRSGSPPPHLLRTLDADALQCVFARVPPIHLLHMAHVSSAWRDLCAAAYRRHAVTLVHDAADLPRLVKAAVSGATLCVAPGVHTVDAPVRALWYVEESTEAGHVGNVDVVRICSHAEAARYGLLPPPEDASATVLLCRGHVGFDMGRSLNVLADLVVCRIGNALGTPNAAVYASAGLLRMERCYVGTLRDVAAELPGVLERRAAGLPPAPPPAPPPPGESGLAADLDRSPARMGVWVSPSACVVLRDCTVAHCEGAGLNVARGNARLHNTTVAYSRRGCNVTLGGGGLHAQDSTFLYASRVAVFSLWRAGSLRLTRCQYALESPDAIFCHLNDTQSIVIVDPPEGNGSMWSQGVATLLHPPGVAAQEGV